MTALQNIATLLPVHNGTEPAQQVQMADAIGASTAPVSIKQENRFKHVAANAIHINEHMNLTHSAAAVPTDRIGAMLGTLGSLHP
jgi:hypothetical protein